MPLFFFIKLTLNIKHFFFLLDRVFATNLSTLREETTTTINSPILPSECDWIHDDTCLSNSRQYFHFKEAQKHWAQSTGWALGMVLGEQAPGLLRHSSRTTGISDPDLTAKQMHRCQRRGQRDLSALYRWPPQHTAAPAFSMQSF